MCLGTLCRELAWKPVLCERVLQTSLCLMTDSMGAPLRGAADFQVSDVSGPPSSPVRPVLHYQSTVFGASSKAGYTTHVMSIPMPVNSEIRSGFKFRVFGKGKAIPSQSWTGPEGSRK
jgi:hypothetical protein